MVEAEERASPTPWGARASRWKDRTAAAARSARSHLKSVDVAAILSSATLLGPVVVAPLGVVEDTPFGLRSATLILGLMACLVAIYLIGVKSRGDLSAARALWIMIVFAPASILFGWLTALRANIFFTSSALHEASLILLLFALGAGVLERRAAKGTPSDVMAMSTSNTAVFALLIFWLFTGMNMHVIAAVIMLLTALLLFLTLLLRVPGAIVPIYRARRLRRRKRRAGAAQR